MDRICRVKIVSAALAAFAYTGSSQAATELLYVANNHEGSVSVIAIPEFEVIDQIVDARIFDRLLSGDSNGSNRLPVDKECQTGGRCGERIHSDGRRNQRWNRERLAGLFGIDTAIRIRGLQCLAELAGHDLSEDAEDDFPTLYDYRTHYIRQQEEYTAAWRISKPVIASVHYCAIGKGFEVALFCDITIVTEETRLGYNEMRYGIAAMNMVLPWLVNMKTAKDRFTRALREIGRWCRAHRHWPVADQQAALSLKLQGHYAYYGITGNLPALARFHFEVRRLWRMWLIRRLWHTRMPWSLFDWLSARYPLPPPRVVRSIYRRAATP